MAVSKAVKAAPAKTMVKVPDEDAGRGRWVAREMEVEVDWPSRKGDPVEVIGIYNTVTKEFKWHESVGDILEAHCRDNPDDDYDDLYDIYMREAEAWAATHNADGL